MISLPLPLSTELACLFKTPDFEDSNLSSILCPLGSKFAFSTSTTRKRGSNFFCTYSSSPKLMQGGVKTLGLETFFVITSLRYIPADTDVFNTSSERLKKVTTSYNQIRRCQAVWKKTSDLRRLEHVLFTSPWRRLIYDVLETSDLRRLEDVCFKTSWKRPIYDVLETSDLHRLEDVQFTTSWRRPIYVVLKTSNLRGLGDVWFTTSWGCLI